jgi:hypothetical protein
VNLSLNGCAVRSTSSVFVAEPMLISLRLQPDPHSLPISVEMGKVRWAMNDQFGVEFLMLASKDRTRLQLLIRTAMTSSSSAA